ncbi:MAG: Flp pilus assembly protein CpaB [Anaerolineales bacterium]|nr:Flp pilus assembly protein CpaB [Anaerolineales bacterium]
MKKPRNSFLVIGILALVAFGLTYALLSGIVQPRSVVVARGDLAAGTRLTADLLELKTLPRAGIPANTYTSIEEAVDKVLTTARVAGDPITSYVAGESDVSSGLPAQLAADSVAISIKVDQATGLAGIVRPGQRVVVIGVIDPSKIPQASTQSITGQAYPLPEESNSLVQPSPIPPTPTPQPPPSTLARIVITGLRVLVVPQSFRYEEAPPSGEGDGFLPARTTTSLQDESVILLEAPVTPIEITPGLIISPAELLALLNQTAVIHLALEPAAGLTIRVDTLPVVDLAEFYETLSGRHLTP